jgi:hypothetical protein
VSYVRWSSVGHPWDYDSDLYIFDSVDGTVCCACGLILDDRSWLGDQNGDMTHPETVAHVREHITAGHRVPDFVIERLSDPENGGFN